MSKQQLKLDSEESDLHYIYLAIIVSFFVIGTVVIVGMMLL